MRSEDSVYFSAEEGDPSAHESHGAANQRSAQFPRPLKLSVFQDPDEDADGDITLRGHSLAQIYNESHRTKDEMPVQIPRPPQFSLSEDSDEDACENKGKGKHTAESLRFPHHDTSDPVHLLDSDIGDKTITLTHIPLPASKDLSLATQSPRVGCLDATSSLHGAPDPTCRNGIETMEVGLSNVVKETMTRVIEEIMQTRGPAGYNADEEDSEVSPHKKRRPKGQPRHWRPDINLFHKNICEHALRLMHRTQWDSPFTDVPTKAEVEAYKPGLGPSCTSDHFRVNLSAMPNGDWNKSASHTFVQSFRDAYPDCAKSLKDICVAWERHFNRLRQIYWDHQERAQLAQVELTRMAAGHPADPGNMKTKLYSQQHPSAVRTIEELVGGAARYTIVSKEWQSGEVTELLRLLDALHLHFRYHNNWNATSGAWPHLRLISHKSSTRAAVKGSWCLSLRKHLMSFSQSSRHSRWEFQMVLESLSISPHFIPSLNWKSYTRLAKPYDVFNQRIVSGHANIPGSAGEETTVVQADCGD
ncbi:hypothetical protein EDD15DRAFT_2191385 [Pisolithus albus]|nr:hypothetical protein EDD15DRAFT_2191385 [Pisolithus albus]